MKFVMSPYGNEILEPPDGGDLSWYVSYREEQNKATMMVDFMASLMGGFEQYFGPETALMIVEEGELRKWYVLRGDHRREYEAAYDGTAGAMKAVYDKLKGEHKHGYESRG